MNQKMEENIWEIEKRGILVVEEKIKYGKLKNKQPKN